MSRVEDIARVDLDLRELEAEANGILRTYQKYNQDVIDGIKEILIEAKVWDDVHSMEMEREDVRKKADARIEAIKAKAQDLHKVRQYFIGLNGSSPAPSMNGNVTASPSPVSPPEEGEVEKDVGVPVLDEKIGDDEDAPMPDLEPEDPSVGLEELEASMRSLPSSPKLRIRPSAPQF